MGALILHLRHATTTPPIPRYKNPPHWSLVEGCNGALAGMVAICASADAIDLWAAWVLGALGAVAFKLLGSLVHRCGIDDVCDAVGLHLGGGITGVRTPSPPQT